MEWDEEEKYSVYDAFAALENFFDNDFNRRRADDRGFNHLKDNDIARIKQMCEKGLSEDEIQERKDRVESGYQPSVPDWPTYDNDCHSMDSHMDAVRISMAKEVENGFENYGDHLDLMNAYEEILRYEKYKETTKQIKEKYEKNYLRSLGNIEDYFGEIKDEKPPYFKNINGVPTGPFIDKKTAREYINEKNEKLAMLMQDRDKFSKLEFANMVADIENVYERKIVDMKDEMWTANERASDQGKEPVYKDEDFAYDKDPSRELINRNAQQALEEANEFIEAQSKNGYVSPKLKAMKDNISLHANEIKENLPSPKIEQKGKYKEAVEDIYKENITQNSTPEEKQNLTKRLGFIGTLFKFVGCIVLKTMEELSEEANSMTSRMAKLMGVDSPESKKEVSQYQQMYEQLKEDLKERLPFRNSVKDLKNGNKEKEMKVE